MPHTPAPWKFSPVDPCTIAIVDDDGSPIFNMTAGLNTTGQSALADNSRLVCAAPAMLEALQAIVCHEQGLQKFRLEKALAAIRAATGE